jgi:hypothetical protein
MRTLHISFEGNAPGEIAVEDNLNSLSCTGDCDVSVQIGASVRMLARTPSRFDGWSGPCAGAQLTCTFTLTTTTDASARFAHESHELWSRFFDGPLLGIRSAAFDPDDNLIVATSSTLDKLDPDGSILWSVPLPASATSLRCWQDPQMAARCIDSPRMDSSCGPAPWERPAVMAVSMTAL